MKKIETVQNGMTETLAVIDAPHFFAGIVLWDDRVVEAADIVRYMRKWPRDRVRDYCRSKGWNVSVVSQTEREDRKIKCDHCSGLGDIGPARTPEGDWVDQPCPKCLGARWLTIKEKLTPPGPG